MEWKAAAKVYAEKRATFAAMSHEEFGDYYQRWCPQAQKALASTTLTEEIRAKWFGFYDALDDELTRRDVFAHESEAAVVTEADSWLADVLKYLYEEVEGAALLAGPQ